MFGLQVRLFHLREQITQQLQLGTPTNLDALPVLMNTNSSFSRPPRKQEPVTPEENSLYELPSRHSNIATRPVSNKTHLIFHVGPPKTGTTSLQTDLTHMQTFLDQDDYFYAGRYYNSYHSTTTGDMILNRSDSVLAEKAKVMLKRRFCKLRPMSACLEEFKTELQQYRGKKNVILSNESWGSMVFKTREDYAAIQEALGDDWQVTVVVGYRPFFQWIRSDMFQRARMDMLVPWKTEWPTGSDNTRGLPVRTLFPDYYKYDTWYNSAPNPPRFTDFVIRNAANSVHVRVMNLVDDDDRESLRTKFACHMLPNAPSTCAASRRLDQSEEGGDRRWLNANNNKDLAVLHVHYDLLTTREQYSRVMVREALRNFTQGQLGATPMDFLLSCPTEQELENFLELSLELEKTCLGEEWAAYTKAKSIAAFQADVEAKVFCTVDTDSNLRKEPWTSFLKQFSSNANKIDLKSSP
jgi:hypothetical protein